MQRRRKEEEGGGGGGRRTAKAGDAMCLGGRNAVKHRAMAGQA